MKGVAQRLLLVVGLLGTSQTALGAPHEPFPKVCDPEDPERCSQPLQRGQVAGFDGQLLTPTLAAYLAARAEGCNDRIGLEVRRVEEISAAKLDLQQSLRKIDQEANAAMIDVYRRQLDLALEDKRAFYEKPWFVAAASILGTAVIYTLAIKGAQALDN